MTLIRKIIIVLVGLSLAILITVLLVNPDVIATLAQSLSSTSALIRLPLAILIDAVILAVLTILVRETRPARPAGGLMVKAQGAIADVSVESATDRILRAVRNVPDVLSASATVKALHGKTDVDLDVVVARASKSLPDKQKEIDRALRQVINKELGLQMAGKPRVHIRMDDEASLNPPPVPSASLPSGTTTTSESVIEPEVQGEEPLKVETLGFKDAKTLRGEAETEDDSTEAVEPASNENEDEAKTGENPILPQS